MADQPRAKSREELCQEAVRQKLGEGLRKRYETVDPLPAQWLDLLRRLGDEGGADAQG